MFTKPATNTPKRPEPDRCERERERDHDRDRDRGKDRNANGPTKRPKVTPEYHGPHTRQLPAECQALLTNLTGTRFPPMSTARKAAGVDNDADLASALGHTPCMANVHGVVEKTKDGSAKLTNISIMEIAFETGAAAVPRVRHVRQMRMA